MTNLSSVKGIGPKIEKYFINLGINDVRDLLYFFPRDYETFEEPVDIINLEAGKVSTINAMVVTKPSLFKKGRTNITSLWLDDGTGRIKAFWFNIPFINKSLTIGTSKIFRGKVGRLKNGIGLSQCKIYKKEVYDSFKGNLSPVYPLTKGLTNNTVKKAIRALLDDDKLNNKYFTEYLSSEIIKERELCSIDYAIKHIHFPNDIEDMKKARKRLVYDEFFIFSLAMFSNKDKKMRDGRMELKGVQESVMASFINKLPFSLTDGQRNAINDIISDFKAGKKMNRLLEGDVGSGKTIVALLSAFLVADMRIQTAFMAPTEVLAEQHFNSVKSLIMSANQKKAINNSEKSNSASESKNIFSENGICIALLTGSTKLKDKKIILEKLASGEIDIIIGTHALFSKDVVYHDLGLCIIDEQHRFGVNQRQLLEEKSNNANVLVMSATPIPRTLAMLFYADMDISRITEKPQNRLPIKNYVANINEREKAYRSMKKQIDLGHQAYVICPAIERSDNDDLGSFANYQNVNDYAERLKSFYGNDVRIGILHGKMKTDEKYEVMKSFKEGNIDILVSTTVVEVGVDVPNATFIMVEDAEAFGLAELHQLRGRVGRENTQSYALFVDTNPSEKSAKRLKVLKDSNDGFYISEEDLKLRGPGDIFGVKQSGEMDFKLADMYTDIQLFRFASVDAKEFIDKKYELTEPLKLKLKDYVKKGLII
ncbi:MAG: ATP-dependent DNA helicase RecG [Lachnospiraceae bacterium]|nr:ATP-dependent DNA helicase RecG [Lachnospiraceae bacterium]